MNLFSIFQKKNSGEIARTRLKLLLVSDRTDCSPELIEMIKDDLVRVISKYMEIDARGVEIQMKQMKPAGKGRSVPALYAHIPILKTGK